MKKASTDPKVKKTLLRNYEQKVRSDRKVPHVSTNSTKDKSCYKRGNDLDQPTLCSSEALVDYLSDVRKSRPPPISVEDLQVNNAEINTKVTKKLNFHFNDHIYKNLVELNADLANIKAKKDKRTNKSTNTIKKDQEPNIEDFVHNEKEDDLSPNIAALKPKFKPIRSMEQGQLHRLVASFEKL